MSLYAIRANHAKKQRNAEVMSAVLETERRRVRFSELAVSLQNGMCAVLADLYQLFSSGICDTRAVKIVRTVLHVQLSSLSDFGGRESRGKESCQMRTGVLELKDSCTSRSM